MNNEMELAAGVLTILAALIIGGSIVGLVFEFGYPKIIRKDAITILSTLDNNRYTVPYIYYLFGFGGFILVYASVCLGNYELNYGEKIFSQLGEISGIIYGTLLFVGILRYTKLFPQIGKWMREEKINKHEAEVIFNSFNIYVGESIAEHVAFVFLTAMIFFNTLSILVSSCVSTWIGYCGIIIAIGMCIGNLEFLGLKKVFIINRIFSSLGAIWLLVLGVDIICK